VLDPAAVRARLADVRERIARAADRAGRDPSRVRLIAVSKTFGADAVRAAAQAGQVDFGENKLQEAQQKRQETTDLPLRWHLVGHLQSNKARKAAAEFDVIHSIDSAALLQKVDEAAAAVGRRIQLLVQVDLAGEATKHGAHENELALIFDAARRATRASVAGLMLLPPAVEKPEDARQWFRKLREMRETLVAGGVSESMLTELSMGMSHDYEVAVEEGATFVRIGTAIFGRRGAA
jgi:pyridoxal phosphate enzyme (YggS family)